MFLACLIDWHIIVMNTPIRNPLLPKSRAGCTEGRNRCCIQRINQWGVIGGRKGRKGGRGRRRWRSRGRRGESRRGKQIIKYRWIRGRGRRSGRRRWMSWGRRGDGGSKSGGETEQSSLKGGLKQRQESGGRRRGLNETTKGEEKKKEEKRKRNRWRKWRKREEMGERVMKEGRNEEEARVKGRKKTKLEWMNDCCCS